MNKDTLNTVVEPEQLASDYVSSADAATFLNLSRQRISALVKEGRLEAVRVHGRRVMVSRDSLAAYDRERRIGRPYFPIERTLA